MLAASTRQPVLVDFWAPWCGPCKQLAPVLEKAVADSKGKVTLVKMNIDDHPQIPGQLGIQSIPAVIAFDKGQPVDGFMGALPESQVRGFIERLVGPLGGGADAILRRRKRRWPQGDTEGAADLYARILSEDETHPKAIGGLARLHVEAGDLDQAKAVLSMAPPTAPGKDPDPAIAAAWAAVHLAEQAASVGDLAPLEKKLAANPDDHQARFDLAVALERQGRAGQRGESAAGDHQARPPMERGRRAQAAVAVLRGMGFDGPVHGRGAPEIVGDLVLMVEARLP